MMDRTTDRDWIEHDGKGLPAGMGLNSYPLVRFRCGSECEEFAANERLWDWYVGLPEACDIVAYCLDLCDVERQRKQRLKADLIARKSHRFAAA